MLNKIRQSIKNRILVNRKQLTTLEQIFSSVKRMDVSRIDEAYQVVARLATEAKTPQQQSEAQILKSLVLIKDNYESIACIAKWVREAEKRTTVPSGLTGFCKDAIIGYEYLSTQVSAYQSLVKKVSPDKDLTALNNLRYYISVTEASISVMNDNISTIRNFIKNH